MIAVTHILFLSGGNGRNAISGAERHVLTLVQELASLARQLFRPLPALAGRVGKPLPCFLASRRRVKERDGRPRQRAERKRQQNRAA